MSEKIDVMCQYCLESHKTVFRDDGSIDYPEICPHCRTTKCKECGGILKGSANFCFHCGEIDPDFIGMHVRTSSTSAAYAENNWSKKVKRWNDSFGELEDDNHCYEIWTDIESGEKQLKEVTVEDGERVILSEETLSDEQVDKL